MNNIFKDFNFTKKYKNELTNFLRKNTTIEMGGEKIFDGSYNHLLHIPEELTDLIFYLKKIQKNNKKKFSNYLEIGLNNGITNSILNRFFHFEKIVAIDPLGPHINAEVMNANLRFKNMILICNGSETKFTNEILKSLSKFDLIFIDGDHSYNSVKKDFDLSQKYINKKGIIILHDIFLPNSGPYKLWRDIKSNFKTKEILYPKNSFKFGFGIIQT